MPSSHTPAETLYADSTASVRSGPASGRSPTSPPVVSVTLTVDLYSNLRIAEWSEKIKWKNQTIARKGSQRFRPTRSGLEQTPEWPLSKGEKRENRGKFPGFPLEGGKR